VAGPHRYQFNPHLLHPETTTNILCKSLTVFPSPAFSLALSLLPTYHLLLSSSSSPTSDLTESIQKLAQLNTLLESAQYGLFWSTLNGDDLYADLVADVAGFEELIRIRIAIEIGKAFRSIGKDVLGGWLDLRTSELEKFVKDVCGWEVEDGSIKVPTNKENEARGEVRRERVGFDREFYDVLVLYNWCLMS
jgi:translation initiation factor 3 subunit K